MHTNEGGNITLPGNFKCEENKVVSLINTTYLGISTSNLSNPRQYFLECTILFTLNIKVNCLNAKMLRKFHREAQVIIIIIIIIIIKRSSDCTSIIH